MSRKALLIGASGSGKSYLQGVKVDLVNMKAFLTSAQGGGWYSSEITTLIDPTLQEILEAKRHIKADYTITLFSGHGFEDDFSKKFLVLSDGTYFNDKLLLNSSSKQLVLIDSCRNFIQTGISGIEIGDSWSHFDGGGEKLKVARALYDHWIKESLPGKLIIHSTKSGDYSYDTKQGGVFTQNLLNAAYNVPVKEKIQVSSIYATAKKAVSLINENGFNQCPVITFKQGNIKLPFAMSLPEPKRIIKRTFIPKKETSNAPLVFGALALLLLAAVSD